MDKDSLEEGTNPNRKTSKSRSSSSRSSSSDNSEKRTMRELAAFQAKLLQTQKKKESPKPALEPENKPKSILSSSDKEFVAEKELKNNEIQEKKASKGSSSGSDKELNRPEENKLFRDSLDESSFASLHNQGISDDKIGLDEVQGGKENFEKNRDEPEKSEIVEVVSKSSSSEGKDLPNPIPYSTQEIKLSLPEENPPTEEISKSQFSLESFPSQVHKRKSSSESSPDELLQPNIPPSNKSHSSSSSSNPKIEDPLAKSTPEKMLFSSPENPLENPSTDKLTPVVLQRKSSSSSEPTPISEVLIKNSYSLSDKEENQKIDKSDKDLGNDSLKLTGGGLKVENEIDDPLREGGKKGNDFSSGKEHRKEEEKGDSIQKTNINKQIIHEPTISEMSVKNTPVTSKSQFEQRKAENSFETKKGSEDRHGGSTCGKCGII